jgi:hypothetical protein
VLGGESTATCRAVTGNGSWKVDDTGAVQLIFDSGEGLPSTLPYGTQLHVGGVLRTLLFYYDGGSDTGMRIEFEKHQIRDPE